MNNFSTKKKTNTRGITLKEIKVWRKLTEFHQKPGLISLLFWTHVTPVCPKTTTTTKKYFHPKNHIGQF